MSVPLVCGVLVYSALFGRWRIPQDGMYPSYPAGSHLLVRKLPYQSVAEVRRGEVVIFKQERDGDRHDFIWRVVALPRERIAIRADVVYINGRPLAQRRMREADGFTIVEETADTGVYEIAISTTPPEPSELAEREVPDGHVFLLGDNRHNAVDSRTSGPVAFEALIGRVIW